MRLTAIPFSCLLPCMRSQNLVSSPTRKYITSSSYHCGHHRARASTPACHIPLDGGSLSSIPCKLRHTRYYETADYQLGSVVTSGWLACTNVETMTESIAERSRKKRQRARGCSPIRQSPSPIHNLVNLANDQRLLGK
ncbi:hypothetical protein F4778DRAFT_313475 [Xylariomycetidae sp. FL2044]|nr:hypothetical protein F4778DRAFT_313475 [Xylariomycetidae sp. FL2044]